MGFDKLLSFFTKNLQNNIVEDLYNKPIVVANHIYFDMNFIVYNSIANIENDINTIYMLIFALPYTDIDRIKKKLSNILDSYYWQKALQPNINIISLDNNIDEIIKQIKSIIDTYIYDLLYWNVFFTINTSIKNNHPIQFIRSINIFFDGIPTFAKMVEQRRRRMKNYIDSQNRKKLFAQYFSNIVNTLITEDDITYDYFEWLKYLYNFSGQLGPNSEIMIILGDFIIIKLKEEWNNPSINFTLSNSTQNGEADYKIFKHMRDNAIDCNVVIHSCDSDFIFMIIWYQLWCNTSDIDINLMMINYNKVIGLKNEIANTLISGKKINALLLEKYNIINSLNTTDVNINIIFDLLFILLMFGNDIIPPNYELGTELNLKLLFETHYSLYHNCNFVVCLNNINIINFNNLARWLKLIQSKRSFSIIILNRFYKLPYNFIINVTKKFNIIEMIDNVLIPFHIKQYEKDILSKDILSDKNNSIQVDNMDFRCKLKLDYKPDEIDSYFTDDMNDYIDILNVNDYGLIRVERAYDINNNSYQTLYNHIIITAANLTEDEFNRPYKIFFNNIKDSINSYTKLTENCNTREYLTLLIYMSQIFFYNFDSYTPYALFNYSDMIAPSIDMILNFIDINDMNHIQNECYIKKIKTNVYFNYTSHHLFITPYLLENNYLGIKDIEHIESLLNVINNCMPGIWYKKNEQFILKKIDPEQFITICNNMIKLYQDNIINNIFKKSSNLLN